MRWLDGCEADSGLLPGALGLQDPPPLVSAAGTCRPRQAAGVVWDNPPQGPARGSAQGGLRKGCVVFGGARGLTERGRRRAAAVRARDVEMLDGRQLPGHCPALATRPAVNLKGPQDDIVTSAADGGPGRRLVSRGQQSCLSRRSCPLSSVSRGLGSLSAR